MIASESQLLPISQISIDGGTQSRAELNEETIYDYAEAMKIGEKFPPVTVFYDGERYWLADGYHRVSAAKHAELSHVASDIKQGTLRDAILFSVSANNSHGLRRTNADKRRAVEVLLRDEEWGRWSNNEIAKRCGVGHDLVNRLRGEFSLDESSSENRTYITKHGTTAIMNISAVGSRRKGIEEAIEQPRPTVGERLQREAYEPFISAKSDEHYTPPEVIAAVVDCMGTIHLDPCSNSHIDPNIPSINHFVQEDDGLSSPWATPTLFLNPPYSEVNLWLQKLIKEINAGNTHEAITLTKADPSTQWFQLIWSNASMICFAHKRLAFISDTNEGNSAPFPSCLAYFGANPEKFYYAFHGNIGVCCQVVEPEFHLAKQ